MVGRAFAFRLYKHPHIPEILFEIRVNKREKLLQPLAVWVDKYLYFRAVLRGWRESFFTFKNPREGSSVPVRSESFTSSPLSFLSVSVSGLNKSEPAKAKAVTISGEATKAFVAGFPSLRLEKFLL